MPDISKVIFGTMRMGDHSKSTEEWSDFFWQLYQAGIRRLHVSSEYETFPLLCRVLAHFYTQHPEARFWYVVKLGEPHFSDADFDADRLITKIKAYLTALNTDHIDCVQWMWRQGLDDDPKRIGQFELKHNEIDFAFNHCKRQGWVKTFVCFAYSPAFAASALKIDQIDGLAVYWNPVERDYEENILAAQALGKYTIAIRPFGGDQSLPSRYSVHELLDFSFNQPGVSGVVVTATHPDHLATLLKYLGVFQ